MFLEVILLMGAVVSLQRSITGAALPLWVPHQWGCSGLCEGICLCFTASFRKKVNEVEEWGHSFSTARSPQQEGDSPMACTL